MNAGLLALAGFRLLAVQGSWNYDRMLGIGVGHATEPLLRDLPGGRAGGPYREALARAVGSFNAHPYLAGLAVGALGRAERDGVAGAEIERLRTALRGPLGSVGDRLVWGGTLPVASGVGLAASAAAGPWLGPVALLAVHNVPHLWLRFWGLRAGWALGKELIRALQSPFLLAMLRIVGPAALLVLGIALPVAAARLVAGLDLAAQAAVPAVFVLTFVIGRWLAPALRGPLLGVLIAAAVVLGGWL